jgi:GTP cyclohydrolase III
MACDCKNSHEDQLIKFPKGAKVVAVSSFNDIQQLDIGNVVDHCEDGRAVIFFLGRDNAHTFHCPDEYIARLYQH